MELEALIRSLRQQAGLQSKRDIQAPARSFPHNPFPELGAAAALGDDAALLPAQTGALLLACEGMAPELVEEDPWFAGWSGVLVNLSDIAAMGGRPIAVVNSLWARAGDHAAALLAGMRFACDTFGVPMVGGHTNQHSPYNALSVAVLGAASGPLLSARRAQAGDELWMLVNGAGHFHRHYPFWDAATEADPPVLRAHLALLEQLAAAGIVHAAKDISMGGIAGTAVMFAEAAGCRLSLALDAIGRPAGVGELEWLTCFPSFGFLLAVKPGKGEHLLARVASHGPLLCCRIGAFADGPPGLALCRGPEQGLLWDGHEQLTGFGASPYESPPPASPASSR
jgi:AIR synthase-related protein